ncbi:MAG: multicopper oxidase domain-containing protein [Nitrososphaeraceae archaeon]|nr:multicopper oxidase domain-containing protein [Nitrososphaeraceae archaeon]
MMKCYLSISILLSTVLSIMLGFGNFTSVITTAFSQEFNGNSEYHYPVVHKIELSVQTIEKQGGNLYAYQLDSHKIYDPKTSLLLNDITDRYATGPTIPGPTLMIEEGDSVELTLTNPEVNGVPGMVGIHVHGIDYPLSSDGTLKVVNGLRNEGVFPGQSITYHYSAGPSTAGTWPYHDHTLGLNPTGMNMNGAETLGLFGNLVIDSHTGKTVALVDGAPTKVNIADISKDILCYVTDDAFWCDEIDYRNFAKHKALWENPTIGAIDGDLIRFHLYGMGTDFHIFELTGYDWLDPGTTQIIKQKKFGPLENHVFTIKAKNGIAEYRDTITSHELSGMKGSFVVDSNGQSIQGKSPLEVDNRI